MLTNDTDNQHSTEEKFDENEDHSDDRVEEKCDDVNESLKRKSTQLPHKNVKKIKLSVKLKEFDIGITEYIGKHNGFFGIIKHRFTDFHVNEIDLNGQVAKLIHQDIPPVNSNDDDDLKLSVPPVIREQLEVLKENTFKQLDIDATNFSKEERRSIHMLANKLAKVNSQTINEGSKKMIVIVSSSNTDCKIRKDNREDWTNRGGNYCHFLLHKVNKDTSEAVNQLAMKLGMKSNNFAYAGMKDSRAWTTQWISVKKVNPYKILQACRSLPGIYVGNFKYSKTNLKLGMLYGNQFRIALRNVRATEEEIEQAMTSLRDNGFINYYGLQRFGTNINTPTHKIGKYLLQGKWNETIELILAPRPEESNKDLAEAKQIYADTKDPHAAYAKIKQPHLLEAKLLKGLQESGNNNPQGALNFIPRNIQLIYIHAYQSFIWNHIVSRRLKEFGTNVIVGDLVHDKQDCKENDEVSDEIRDDFPQDDINNEANAICSEEKDDHVIASKPTENSLRKHSSRVKILTEEDLPNYTLADVIMPQPGWKVTYPPYAKAWYDEFLSKDELTTNLIQKNKKFNLNGTYRKILTFPTNLSWNIMHYKDKNDNLILTNIDEMRKRPAPCDEPDGQFKALILEMCLSSSSYATMALREILRNDTSAETQAALSASNF